MKKIIVVGSLNMDLTISVDKIPDEGETLHGHDFLMNNGGKGGNQAIAAVRAGANTLFIGSVGKDSFGSAILESLKNNGINVDSVEIQENESTGLAMIICHNNDNRIILNPGANFSLSLDFAKDKLSKLVQEGDYFVTQFENDFFTTLQLLEYAKGIGMRTILNPAPAKVFPDEFYKYIDILVLNQSECEILTHIYPKTIEDCELVGQVFRGKGTGNVVITMGELGSVTITDKEVIKVKAYKVKVVDSTAAGDCFIGAMAAQLSFGNSLNEALEYATKASAITVTKKGAQISIPNNEEINEFFKK